MNRVYSDICRLVKECLFAFKRVAGVAWMRDDQQAYLADVCAYGRNQSQVAALIKMEIAKLQNFNFELHNLHCQELESQGMRADCGCSRNTASTLHCSHLKQCASRAGIEEAKFAYEANVNLRLSQTIIQYIIFQ